MKLKPLKNMVLLQKVEVAREKVEGGIIIAGVDETQPFEATVIECGPEVVEVVADNVVLVSREDGMGGFPIKLNGDTFIMIEECEILALVEG